MKARLWCAVLLVAGALSQVAGAGAGADSTDPAWPQFRGPRGSGQSSALGLPLTWSEQENVAWKVAVPGRGFSSPVVLGGQVWMTTADEEAHSLRALSFDAATGRLVKNLEVFHPAAWQGTHLENSYASPTPVLEKGRVYVHFGTYGTAALDSHDGRILWRNEDLKIDHEVGPGSSPILWKDLLIVNCDGTDHQYVAALEKATGKLAWKTPRIFGPGKKGTHMKAFSTPIVIQHLGHPQLITAGADQVSALDPRTGREIWRVRFEGYSVVPQPLSGLGLVWISTGYVKPQLQAIRLGGEGDVTDTNVLWEYHWQVPTNPTPLLIGDRIFMVNDWGNATWLDARKGVDVWRQRLRGHFWASPIHALGRIYAWSEDGKTTVIAADDQYQILASNQLDATIHTTPAIAGHAFYVRSTTHLYRLEDLAAKAP